MPRKMIMIIETGDCMLVSTEDNMSRKEVVQMLLSAAHDMMVKEAKENAQEESK